MTVPAEFWPWIVIAGLGAFHGLNPAMGWLFAVALGLHRGGRATILLSLGPIAAGHLAAVGLTLALLVSLGRVVAPALLLKACGAALFAWAAWHLVAGHRRRLRIGLSAGLASLALWSFAMALGHGAGLMLAAVALPLCLGETAGAASAAGRTVATALAVLAIHTSAMLAVVAVVALTVYDWIGLGILRRGWINFDVLWGAALAATGLILLHG